MVTNHVDIMLAESGPGGARLRAQLELDFALAHHLGTSPRHLAHHLASGARGAAFNSTRKRGSFQSFCWSLGRGLRVNRSACQLKRRSCKPDEALLHGVHTKRLRSLASAGAGGSAGGLRLVRESQQQHIDTVCIRGGWLGCGCEAQGPRVATYSLLAPGFEARLASLAHPDASARAPRHHTGRCAQRRMRATLQLSAVSLTGFCISTSADAPAHTTPSINAHVAARGGVLPGPGCGTGRGRTFCARDVRLSDPLSAGPLFLRYKQAASQLRNPAQLERVPLGLTLSKVFAPASATSILAACTKSFHMGSVSSGSPSPWPCCLM